MVGTTIKEEKEKSVTNINIIIILIMINDWYRMHQAQ
jgi:hypothetical protein